MQTIQVKNGQSLFDIAVQYCGSVSAVSSIVKFNNLSFTEDLVEGQKLFVPDITNIKVVNDFLNEAFSPANAVNVEPWDVVLITDTYEVLRTFEVNFSNAYCSGSALNRFDAVDDVIFIRDNTNTLMSGVVVTALNVFGSADCVVMPDGEYIRDSYLIRSGMSVANAGSRLGILGLDPNKFYQFYIVAGDESASGGINIQIGTKQVSRITNGNFPFSSQGDIYSNPAVIRFKNVVPNSSGEIDIDFTRLGTYWFNVAINYLIVEETNEMKV